jgi:hypothetical protein
MTTLSFSDFDAFHQFINNPSLASTFERNMFRMVDNDLVNYDNGGGVWKSYTFSNGGVCAVPPIMDKYTLGTFGQNEDANFGKGDGARLAYGLTLTELLLNRMGTMLYDNNRIDEAKIMFDCKEMLYALILDETLFNEQQQIAYYYSAY